MRKCRKSYIDYDTCETPKKPEDWDNALVYELFMREMQSDNEIPFAQKNRANHNFSKLDSEINSEMDEEMLDILFQE